MGVASGSGEVGLIPTDEENKGEGGSLVDVETESTIVKDLPKVSTTSMAKMWSPFSLAGISTAEGIMTGASLPDASVVLQGNIHPP